MKTDTQNENLQKWITERMGTDGIEEELEEILGEEIARELLKELDPDISTERVEEVWAKCDGNPWNAKIIYSISKTIKP
jgi:hypothetical protein